MPSRSWCQCCCPGSPDPASSRALCPSLQGPASAVRPGEQPRRAGLGAGHLLAALHHRAPRERRRAGPLPQVCIGPDPDARAGGAASGVPGVGSAIGRGACGSRVAVGPDAGAGGGPLKVGLGTAFNCCRAWARAVGDGGGNRDGRCISWPWCQSMQRLPFVLPCDSRSPAPTSMAWLHRLRGLTAPVRLARRTALPLPPLCCSAPAADRKDRASHRPGAAPPPGAGACRAPPLLRQAVGE